MAQAAENTAKQILDGGNCPRKLPCPIHDLIARLGDKWSMMVLIALARHPGNTLRFSELMREVEGVSQRMLTTTLRHLERDGILTRKLYAEVPPRVEYTLAERGFGLLVPVKTLVEWLTAQWPEIEKSRSAYDAIQKEKL